MANCQRLLSALKRPLEHTDILPAVRSGKRATNGGTKSTSVRPLSTVRLRKPALRFCTRCATFACAVGYGSKILDADGNPEPIKDTSNNGVYHNKRFKAMAEAHGLEVEHHPKYGWTITSPGIDLLDFIESQGWQDLQMVEGVSLLDVLGTLPKGGSRTKKPSSTRKYICPKCGNSCRATKAINIICGDCMEKMVVSE